jgi:integrase
MARKSNRFPVGPGISVFLRFKTWWADIRKDGARFQKNLHTHDYKEAVARALEQAKGPVVAQGVLWSKAVETYLQDHSSLYHAEASKQKAQSVLREFGAVVSDTTAREEFNIGTVRREQVEGWLRRVADRVEPATVNSKLRTLRAFLRWSVGKGWIASDPSAGIRRLREVKRDDKELTPDELGRILKMAGELGEEFIADLFRLALNTGARPGELVNLRAEDVDLEGRVLFLRNRASHALKDRADRRVKLNDLALEVLRRRKLAAGMGLDGLLFPSVAGTVPDLSNLAHRFKRIAVRAGVPRANMYMARHTFASLAAVYLPQFVLQDILGHSDPSLTARHYVHAASAKAPAPPVIGG